MFCNRIKMDGLVNGPPVPPFSGWPGTLGRCSSPGEFRKENRGKGFTLLEVLVSLALLSLLSAALYSTYFGLMKARESATAGMDSRRDLRITLDLVRKEIASAFFNPNNKRLHFIVEDRDLFGKPASTLMLTTISVPGGDHGPVSDLVEVKYSPVEKEGKLALTRQARDVYLVSEPIPYPQMDELEGFLLECFDGRQWIKSWNTDLNGKLPKAVRVTIWFKEGEKTVAFSTVSIPKVKGT